MKIIVHLNFDKREGLYNKMLEIYDIDVNDNYLKYVDKNEFDFGKTLVSVYKQINKNGKFLLYYYFLKNLKLIFLDDDK